MRDVDFQIVGGERAHRGQHRADAAGDVTDDKDGRGQSDQHHQRQRGNHHTERQFIVLFGFEPGRGRALVVQIDKLRQHRIHTAAGDRRALSVDGPRLRGLALAGMGHHLVGGFAEGFPGGRQLLVQRRLLGRGNQRLIGLVGGVVILGARIEIALDVGHEGLVRLRQVVAQHRAITGGLGAQFADQTDAWQPACLDVLRGRIDGAHLEDGEGAHRGEGNQQEGNEGNEFGANGEPGEH